MFYEIALNGQTLTSLSETEAQDELAQGLKAPYAVTAYSATFMGSVVALNGLFTALNGAGNPVASAESLHRLAGML